VAFVRAALTDTGGDAPARSAAGRYSDRTVAVRRRMKCRLA
jgi:hypothetical protein